MQVTSPTCVEFIIERWVRRFDPSFVSYAHNTQMLPKTLLATLCAEASSEVAVMTLLQRAVWAADDAWTEAATRDAVASGLCEVRCAASLIWDAVQGGGE